MKDSSRSWNSFSPPPPPPPYSFIPKWIRNFSAMTRPFLQNISWGEGGGGGERHLTFLTFVMAWAQPGLPGGLIWHSQYLGLSKTYHSFRVVRMSGYICFLSRLVYCWGLFSLVIPGNPGHDVRFPSFSVVSITISTSLFPSTNLFLVSSFFPTPQPLLF